MPSVLGDRKAVLVLLTPALAVYVLIELVPVAWSLGLSLFSGGLLGGFRFVGLDNFVRFAQDPTALHALWFSVAYALVVTVGQVTLGYGLALLYVFGLRRSSTLLRTLVFFPVILPSVAVGLLFQRLFEIGPSPGPVNSLLNLAGLESIDWFSSGWKAFCVIVLMDLWKSIGFYAVLLYAGLIEIPEELLESARVDGARGWRVVRHIVLPLSLPVLVSAIIFSLNASLKVFDAIVALTGGGPGQSTTPLTLYMYDTVFSYNDYGYGSTIATVLTIVSLLVTVMIFRTARRDLTRSRTR